MSKALIINPYWDTLGGGERYVASLAKLLLSRHWQVDINWSDSGLTEKLQTRFGLDLTGVRYSPDTNTEEYQLSFWVSDGSIPTSFSKRTIIHLQFPFRGVGGGSPLNFLKSRFYTFVVNSAFTKSFIDREYHVKSRVIYPPIDTGSFIPGPKRNLILYVGRFSQLTQAKGQSVLIDVFKNLYKKIPGWQLVLAGGTGVGTNSDQIANLNQSIAGLPVKIITDPDFSVIKKLYSEARIFWSATGFGINENTDPTRVEHFGISVVEAMAAGAVPIVTNLGGFKEIVTPGTDGLLWQTTDELAQITLDIIASEHRLNELSRAAVSKSTIFDINHFNSAFTALLKL